MKKDWIARELTAEIVVGVFIVTVVLGLASFTFLLSDQKWGMEKYSMEVIFMDVMGLRVKDSVIARGMPVGEVTGLQLVEDGHGVRIILSLNKQLSMKKDYSITVVSTSILGGRHLEIYEGTDSLPDVPEGVVFRGQEPHDLMSDAAEVVNAFKDGVVEGKMIDNLKDVSVQLKQIAERLNSGEGTLGKLLSADDRMYKDLSDAVASLKRISEKIEKGEGLLGRLVQDDSLYEEIESVIGEVRATVDDYRETAPVVSFTSIFFGAF